MTPQRAGPACSVFAAAVALALILCFIVMRTTLEDAHITFHYAKTFANGDGFGIWNSGEPPVEGFTDLSWMLMIAAGMKLGLSPFVVTKVVGLASLLLIIFLYFRIYITEDPSSTSDERALRQAAPAAALLQAGFLPVAWYAMSGMEALTFSAIVLFALSIPLIFLRISSRCAASLAAGAALIATRPEGALVGLLISAFFVLKYVKLDVRPGLSAAWPFVLGLSTAAAEVAITTFRLAYFHSAVPNTALAKAANGVHQIGPGLIYVGNFAIAMAPLLAIAVFVFLTTQLSRGVKLAADLSLGWPSFLWVFIALYTAYVILVGGDPISAFPMWRHFVHIFPFIALALSCAITPGFQHGRRLWAVLAVGLLASDLLILVKFAPVFRQEIAAKLQAPFALAGEPPYFSWISRFTTPTTVVAVSLAGQWSYYVPGRFIDMLGLSDRHIAMYGHYSKYGPTDSKTDMPYVLGRHPQVIDGYVDGNSLLKSQCPTELTGPRRENLRELFGNPDFYSRYMFVTNAPYSLDIKRSLFVSRGFYEANKSHGLEAVPVLQTVIFSEPCRTSWAR